jgi:hypothetical protein
MFPLTCEFLNVSANMRVLECEALGGWTPSVEIRVTPSEGNEHPSGGNVRKPPQWKLRA